MFAKDQILDAEERVMLRQALFCLQKRLYERQGSLTGHQIHLVDNIATKLHLR